MLALSFLLLFIQFRTSSQGMKPPTFGVSLITTVNLIRGSFMGVAKACPLNPVKFTVSIPLHSKIGKEIKPF